MANIIKGYAIGTLQNWAQNAIGILKKGVQYAMGTLLVRHRNTGKMHKADATTVVEYPQEIRSDIRTSPAIALGCFPLLQRCNFMFFDKLMTIEMDLENV